MQKIVAEGQAAQDVEVFLPVDTVPLPLELVIGAGEAGPEIRTTGIALRRFLLEGDGDNLLEFFRRPEAQRVDGRWR